MTAVGGGRMMMRNCRYSIILMLLPVRETGRLLEGKDVQNLICVPRLDPPLVLLDHLCRP